MVPFQGNGQISPPLGTAYAAQSLSDTPAHFPKVIASVSVFW